MLLAIPDVLTGAQVQQCRKIMDKATWVDGSSSGRSAMQLAENSPVAREVGALVLDAMSRHPLFLSAALPLKIFPPLFERHEAVKTSDDAHKTDGMIAETAIRSLRGTDFRLRSDLSVTLFLSEPEDYHGGALCVDDGFGIQQTKPGAGSAMLYSSSSAGHVAPVTQGLRVTSFFWVQSMVRDDAQRELLFDLDQTIQKLVSEKGQGDQNVIRLTGIYHNLVRGWAET